VRRAASIPITAAIRHRSRSRNRSRSRSWRCAIFIAVGVGVGVENEIERRHERVFGVGRRFWSVVEVLEADQEEAAIPNVQFRFERGFEGK
jgi:hypothetical protein